MWNKLHRSSQEQLKRHQRTTTTQIPWTISTTSCDVDVDKRGSRPRMRLCLDICYCLSCLLDMTRLQRRRVLLAWTLVSALSLYTTSTAASVLAIDYGTDFIKASLMKPGVAFDVLLNRDSKRKIAASIAWKGDERLFGTDALNIVRIISSSLTHPRVG